MSRELVSNNISYSLLKAVDDSGPSALVNRINITSSGITFGKQLDDFISLSKEEFNNKYVMCYSNITGDLEKLAIILAEFDTLPDKEAICRLIESNELFKQVKKDDTRITKFHSLEFYKYVNFLKHNKGKRFITAAEYSKLVDARTSLFNHKSTAPYFNCGDDCEEIYQLEINFGYKGRNIKTILDKVIINHNEETIQPLDLKSGSNDSYEFLSSFMKYKYYMQGGLYVTAVSKWIEGTELSHYKILPFKFIYLPTYNLGNPKTFTLTEKWFNAAWNGFTTRSGYKYRGIDELIDIINWHIEHQVFNETKEFHENLEIELDDSFITV